MEMDDKIKVLTDKIFNEGVEKGKEQADRLIAEAEQKSAEAIASARSEAEKIVAEAKRQAAELKKNTDSEIRLSAGQVLQSVRSTIADTIADKLAVKGVSDATKDSDFLRSLVVKIVENWKPGEQVVVETADANALYDYFKANAKGLLEKGVEIKEASGRPTAFTIIPKDGSYKINFGDEELESFFKSFLRPRLVELLFQ